MQRLHSLCHIAPEPERQPKISNVNIQFNTHEEAHKSCHHKSLSCNVTVPRLTHDIVRWEFFSAVRAVMIYDWD